MGWRLRSAARGRRRLLARLRRQPLGRGVREDVINFRLDAFLPAFLLLPRHVVRPQIRLLLLADLRDVLLELGAHLLGAGVQLGVNGTVYPRGTFGCAACGARSTTQKKTLPSSPLNLSGSRM